jgi:hypothetical protein
VNVGGGLAGFDAGSNWRLVMAPGHPSAAPDAVLGFASFPGGSSGDFESPLYASQLPDWLTVEHHIVPVSEGDVAGFPAEEAVPASVGKAQRACVYEVAARVAAVGDAQSEVAGACLAGAAKGTEPDAQSCLGADAREKVAKAREKARKGEAKKCPPGALPTLAYGGAQVAADAAGAASLGLVEDVFGPDLTESAVVRSADAAGAACQAALQDGARRALATLWKEAGRATKRALAGGQGTAPAQSGSDVQEAVEALLVSGPKLEKAFAKLAATSAKRCGGVADLAAVVPGRCREAGAAGSGALAECVWERVLCRGCRSLNKMEALALPCDALDDGAVNDGCG